jgi:hypothetical protein
VLLSDNLGELLRPIFARQDGIAHEPEDTIIRDQRGMSSPRPHYGRLAKTATQALRLFLD